MTRDELKTFTEGLLDGEVLDETFFDNLMESARAKIENRRPWRILVKEDTSTSAATSDTHETSKNLPSDFRNTVRRTEHQPQMLLVSSDGKTVAWYEQRPFAMRWILRDTHGIGNEPDVDGHGHGHLFGAVGNVHGFFVVDMANSIFYLLGKVSQAFTIHLFYIYNPGPITDSNIWPFPSEHHAVLGYMIAGLYSGAVDWDDINRFLSPNQLAAAEAAMATMTSWDTSLQLADAGQ